jgi:hypothetical protein
VEIPESKTWAVAVVSLVDEIDPRDPSGAYRIRLSRCVGDGPDTDEDGVADVCDDDDDDDGFKDGLDDDPLDPFDCADIDLDGCDDCSSGDFDWFADGVDTDGDGFCDLTDEDDDNDGCEDGLDDDPLVPSDDADLDFLGGDCDNCPRTPNPGQEDADDDRVGDACSQCLLEAWTEEPTRPPDQNPMDSKIIFRWPRTEGRRRFSAEGFFNPAPGSPGLDPAASGVHVFLSDGLGVLYDVNLPAGPVGSSPCHPSDGWSVAVTPDGDVWTYENLSGTADPPTCTPGSAPGLPNLILKDLRASAAAAYHYDFAAGDGALSRATRKPPRFLKFNLAFGVQSAPGALSGAAAAGQCTEFLRFNEGAKLPCKVVKTKKVPGQPREIKRIVCN